LIFRLADRHARDGRVDPDRLGPALTRCRGQLTAVLASREDPGTVLVLRGNKPLCLRYHRGHRVVLYASEATFIDDALDGERGWRDLALPPMTMATLALW
jgi:amidophosphoribosyltransferase